MPIRDLRSCDHACETCIKRYVHKHKLGKGHKFRVNCDGIPQQYVPDSILASVEADPRVAIASFDPVTWAALYLDWHCLDPDGSLWKKKHADGTLKDLPPFRPEDEQRCQEGRSIFHRPYQAQILRCSAKRKVLRIGRQCLAETAILQLSDGSLRSIKDVRIGDRLLSLNTTTNKLEDDLVVDAWKSGRRKIYRIHTQFGHEIECSAQHPFWSARGFCDRTHSKTVDTLEHRWISIEQGLSAGDKIATPASLPVFGVEPLAEGLPELLGYFIADGSASKNQSAKFTNTREEYLTEFEACCKQLGSSVKRYAKGNGYDLIISNGHAVPNPVRSLLSSLGLTGITGPDKFIPEIIFKAPRHQVKTFLERFWAADGYVYTGLRTGRQTSKVEIGMLQESRHLLEQTQHLLLRFGVHSYIKPENGNWRLVLGNKHSVVNFLENLGGIPGKQAAVQKAREAIVSVSDKYLHREEDVLWDHITSIEELDEQDVWDITVEKHHNFVANGLITKNSGKTESICVSILFHIFTHENFSVQVVAPFQSHIELIFKRLNDLISGSPTLRNSIARSVKAPNYTLELFNGSVVRGFTAASRSGGDAGAARGQHANLLVFDEADMLNQADIDAVLAVIINYPDAGIIMSSTPTGKRQSFWKTCQDLQWKEFHYPSYVNPNWSTRHEETFREALSQAGYRHEIEAEFGEQEEGVYQVKYVDHAKTEYTYKDMRWTAGWCYTIGVDWNDVKAGTVITVVGYNPGDRHYYLVDRQVVSRELWNQTAACNKVIELNRVWRPAWIYIDKGFGHMQGETLQLYGHEAARDKTRGHMHPDAALARIVKYYESGSTVEVHDPFTKQPINKPAKPFLVENSVRSFENCVIHYPKADVEYTKQLQGYKIKRVSQAGIPVYEQGDETTGDHLVDSTNLALVAFTLEESIFGAPRYQSGIAFTAERLGEVLTETPPSRISGPGDYAQKSGPTRPQEGRAVFGPRMQQPLHVWSWPGFAHDAPPPQPRQTQSTMRRPQSRPKRTNI